MTTSFLIKKKIKVNFLSLSIFQKLPHKLQSISQQPDNVPLKKLQKSMPGLNATSSPASITFSNKLVHKSDFALKTPVPASKFTAKTFTRASALWNRYPGRRTTFQTGRNVVENWGKSPSSIVVHFIESWRVIHLLYTPSPTPHPPV